MIHQRQSNTNHEPTCKRLPHTTRPDESGTCKSLSTPIARCRLASICKQHVLFSLILILFFIVGQTSASPTRSTLPTAIAYSTHLSSKTNTAASSTQTADSDGGIVSEGGNTTQQVPRAFDTSVASDNFTTPGCLPFFNQFLTNETFIACQPFSFLIKTSKAWFDITRQGLTSVTKALDSSCNVNLQVCSSLMNEFAQQLLRVDSCAAEFKARNPVVTQAYASFITYDTMYKAGCQKSATGYCYADAITNASSISDYVVYYVPLGITIPGGSRLTCNKCLQETMAIFASDAGNSSQPLYDTYAPSAQIINLGCGPNFVSTAVQQTSAAPAKSRPFYHAAYIIPTLMSLFVLL